MFLFKKTLEIFYNSCEQKTQQKQLDKFQCPKKKLETQTSLSQKNGPRNPNVISKSLAKDWNPELWKLRPLNSKRFNLQGCLRHIYQIMEISSGWLVGVISHIDLCVVCYFVSLGVTMVYSVVPSFTVPDMVRNCERNALRTMGFKELWTSQALNHQLTMTLAEIMGNYQPQVVQDFCHSVEKKLGM